MPTKVFVPRLGEGVEEVTVTKWLKNVGDSVNEMDALLEVNTDKVDTEIPAPASGVLLEILIVEGSEAKVGDVLAIIGDAGESVESEMRSPDWQSRVEGLNVKSTEKTPIAHQNTLPPSTSNIQPSTSKDLGNPVWVLSPPSWPASPLKKGLICHKSRGRA
jgi:pyruvate dehydrogenase E2 component (dihydrolipoamide acetyltransferase)